MSQSSSNASRLVACTATALLLFISASCFMSFPCSHYGADSNYLVEKKRFLKIKTRYFIGYQSMIKSNNESVIVPSFNANFRVIEIIEVHYNLKHLGSTTSK